MTHGTKPHYHFVGLGMCSSYHSASALHVCLTPIDCFDDNLLQCSHDPWEFAAMQGVTFSNSFFWVENITINIKASWVSIGVYQNDQWRMMGTNVECHSSVERVESIESIKQQLHPRWLASTKLYRTRDHGFESSWVHNYFLWIIPFVHTFLQPNF